MFPGPLRRPYPANELEELPGSKDSEKGSRLPCHGRTWTSEWKEARSVADRVSRAVRARDEKLLHYPPSHMTAKRSSSKEQEEAHLRLPFRENTSSGNGRLQTLLLSEGCSDLSVSGVSAMIAHVGKNSNNSRHLIVSAETPEVES